MDRSDIRTEVRYILGELSADFWADAELNSYIQEALYRFAAEERWPWYMTEFTGSLAADDPTMDLTTEVAAARHINLSLTKVGDTRMYQPTRVDPSEGFKLRSMYPGTGSYPAYWYITAVLTDQADDEFVYRARFIPTPVGDMDVDAQYYRAPALLEGDSDIPELPTQYHKALVHYAAGTAWLKELNGGAKAEEQFQMYAGVVSQARDEWMMQADDDPIVIGADEPQYKSAGFDPLAVRIAETLGP